MLRTLFTTGNAGMESERQTSLTRLLGIDHPVVLPGMSWISKPELVAAISGAGGLGILATGPLSPEETRASIQDVRKRTDRSMGMPVRPVLQRLLSNPGQARMLAYFGASLPLVEAATINGDTKNGVQFIGQAQGLVEDVPSAAQLVHRVVEEAEAVLRALGTSGPQPVTS
jgi:NAD(P)H-dependent flavin oxidoreductase YrpB (nitropropane dioxygenase family)